MKVASTNTELDDLQEKLIQNNSEINRSISEGFDYQKMLTYII